MAKKFISYWEKKKKDKSTVVCLSTIYHFHTHHEQGGEGWLE